MNLNQVHEYSIDIENREIFLHSHIDDENESGVDYRASINLIKNIRILESLSDKPILIHMDLCGGSWSSGIAMYDTIKMSNCYIKLIVYGRAESMSTIILQGADERILMPNSYLMIHFGSINTEVTVEQYMAESEFYKRELNKMMLIYSERCKNGEYFKNRKDVPRELKRLIKTRGDWYLNPEESIYYGFADKILEEKC